MSTLLLRLAAPLQSWGSDSKFDERKTDYAPTKSGVIGMLAAALGRSREDSIEDLTQLEFGVRVDRQGEIISDLQITDMINYNLNLSHRQYLSDAIFLVGFESENVGFLSSIASALQAPVYPLFLGRRSCPPSIPLVLGIREKGLYQALIDEPWLLPTWQKKRVYRDVRLRILMDADKKTPAVKRDVPLSYSMEHREYGYRYLTEMPPKVIHIENEFEHDPMGEL
jgi:CRISPR system Cascade subunit CasD